MRPGDVFEHVEQVAHFDHRAKFFVEDVKLYKSKANKNSVIIMSSCMSYFSSCTGGGGDSSVVRALDS